ncbi:unnamed protein product [Sphagnum compactum]
MSHKAFHSTYQDSLEKCPSYGLGNEYRKGSIEKTTTIALYIESICMLENPQNTCRGRILGSRTRYTHAQMCKHC